MPGTIRRVTAPSILLVEDNPLHVRLVSAMLSEVWPGFEDLHLARRLDEAVAMLAEVMPDCVLLDLVLPDADGLEAVNVMLAAGPDVPIVVLSSYDDDEMALRAVNEGAQDYLVKGSVDSYELGRSIRFGIQRHEARTDAVTGEVLAFPGQRITAHTVANAGRRVLGATLIDTDGVIERATSEAAGLFGQGLEDLIGSPLRDSIHRDDRSSWDEAVKSIGEDTGAVSEIELCVHDGSDVDRAVVVRIKPMCGADGTIDSLLVTYAESIATESDAPEGTQVAMSDWIG